MAIDTTFLARCTGTLEEAHRLLLGLGDERGGSMYDILRAACAEEFELVLEQSGSLLRKRLRPFFASNRAADRLAFKDLFRYAAKHGLVSAEACERWFAYRDNRNDTAHDYGEAFAEETLRLLPDFIADARALERVLAEAPDAD